MDDAFDAVIVGAGPAGSTAAILLARAGWSVAVVEKQRFPRRKVCGECVAASNLPLLEALGIGADFMEAAGPEQHRVALMFGERTVIADLPAASNLRYRWGRALGRETLDTLLLDAARSAGAVVLQPWAVHAIDGPAGAHRCEIRAIESDEKRTLRASLVIAANGSWEPLPSNRETRRIDRNPGDLFAFKANFRGGALADGLLAVLAFDGGYGGMVVADQHVTTLACCVRRDRLDASRGEAPGARAGEVVETLLKRECRGVEAALDAAQRDGAWLASGPLDPGIRLRDGDALFRIGNAAGEAHPIIGEGMSMAIQSAWCLCGHLIASRRYAGVETDVAWQRGVRQRYVSDWRRQFTARLRLAAAFAYVAMRPAAFASVLGLVGQRPGLLTRAAAWSGKIRCVPDSVSIATLASTTRTVGGVALPAFVPRDARHTPQDTP